MTDTDFLPPCILKYQLNGDWITVELDGPEYTIGRLPSCGIFLDYVMVSREHARLTFDGDAWWIEDLQSRNGVVIDGNRVDRQRLRNGDSIALGDLQLQFFDMREATAAGAFPKSSSPMSKDHDTDTTWIEPTPKATVTSRGSGIVDAGAPRDAVDCTVFAPPLIKLADPFMVQVFAHLPDEADAAARDAAEFDEVAERRGATSLGAEVARGATLSFELMAPDWIIEEPVRDLVWRGRRTSVQFGAQIRPGIKRETTLATITVSQNSVPIGSITFKLLAITDGFLTNPERTGEARRYSQAFISYASHDRSEVIRRVQMLKNVGISFFQDVLDLEPGERWAQRLYERIDQSDVLFLFWSTAAKNSEWVAKEWQYALEKKGDDFIHPVGIEGPPTPEPPDELKHLHFGDPLLYFI